MDRKLIQPRSFQVGCIPVSDPLDDFRNNIAVEVGVADVGGIILVRDHMSEQGNAKCLSEVVLDHEMQTIILTVMIGDVTD
jgi:hypothetical protein